MPTWDKTDRFLDDHAQLCATDRERFRRAVEKFVEDLRRGQGFRPGLRVKGVEGAPGIFEMTWAPDGRATFEYGNPVHSGEPHVVWRRVGSHIIFSSP
jgi:hypothetical protein